MAGWALDLHVAELGRTLGEELLEPTRIYALDCLELARAGRRRRPRLQPRHRRRARGEPRPGAPRRTWRPTSTAPPGPRSPVFGLVGRLGGVARPELERTFNHGRRHGRRRAAPASVDAALARLADRGVDAWVVGDVRARRDGEAGDAAGQGRRRAVPSR